MNKFKSIYKSLFGNIIILVEDSYLIALYFMDNINKLKYNVDEFIYNDNDITIINTKKYLDDYFNHKIPKYDNINIKIDGSNFYNAVINIVLNIPYGKRMTYNDIAYILKIKYNYKKPPCQAVGMALSKNYILIIIPCHRVVGKNNNLTGYSCGKEIKKKLLDLEESNLTYFH